MKKQPLIFEKVLSKIDNHYRAIFKNRHSRLIYIEIIIDNEIGYIPQCFYIDRESFDNQKDMLSYPLKHKTKEFSFSNEELLTVVSNELDRKFYSLKFTDNIETISLSTDKFIGRYLNQNNKKYKFLILQGEGKTTYNGLPTILQTRFKNRLHRSIYIKLYYHGDGKGIIQSCHYYDRVYKNKNKRVSPQSLYSFLFSYNKQTILDIFNQQLNCDFTHILLVCDGTIDVVNNSQPVCGNL